MAIEEKIIQAVDREVGARVRLRRKLIGMTQEKLANRIGVTFQQVQKYEKGTNRIGASRMHQIAVALGVQVASLFGDNDGTGPTNSDQIGPEDSATSKDGIDLNKAFLKIKDTGIRKAVIELVVVLGKDS